MYLCFIALDVSISLLSCVFILMIRQPICNLCTPCMFFADYEIRLMPIFALMITTFYKSLCVLENAIYCEINNWKDYLFSLLAKVVSTFLKHFTDSKQMESYQGWFTARTAQNYLQTNVSKQWNHFFKHTPLKINLRWHFIAWR